MLQRLDSRFGHLMPTCCLPATAWSSSAASWCRVTVGTIEVCTRKGEEMLLHVSAQASKAVMRCWIGTQLLLPKLYTISPGIARVALITIQNLPSLPLPLEGDRHQFPFRIELCQAQSNRQSPTVSL
mmetsp:Transcript_55663/g.110606  ORF Transcript_55663/g.110606 Transcript_55663/m.110606 type:complete len:127 (-) Transcript_55663:1096-1476(-)